MKCELCKQKIEENFLKKPIGTYVKDKDGKKHIICNNCQRLHPSKEKIVEKL